jgi:hypothetical protein
MNKRAAAAETGNPGVRAALIVDARADDGGEVDRWSGVAGHDPRGGRVAVGWMVVLVGFVEGG